MDLRLLFSTISDFFAGESVITTVFIALIVSYWIYLNIRFNDWAADHGPGFLTTLGILATFIGITAGLLKFDPAKMQTSVPDLLTGLKTAFIGSACGVVAALLIKVRDNLFGHHLGPKDDADGFKTEVTAADLAKLLSEIRTALTGAEDGSLISQLKLLRLDTNSKLDSLRTAQEQALKQLSEMGSKTLVEALKDLIRDFNQKISEQFGDNFKELNVAVGRLLIWQEQYKATIEEMARIQQTSVAAMTKATADYASLVQQASGFSEIARDLGTLLTALDTERQAIRDTSTGLAQLLIAAKGNLPEIEAKIVQMVEQISTSMASQQAKFTKQIETNVDAIERSILATNGKMSEATGEFSRAISDNVKSIKLVVDATADSLRTSSIEFGRTVTDLSAKAKDQVGALDKALSEELERSLESLARQLTALSGKFVEDYTPLTDRLRRIVEISERVVS